MDTENIRFQVLKEYGAGEGVQLERVPNPVEEELNLVQLNTDADARRNYAIKVFGQGCHPTLFREIFRQRKIQEFLENTH